MNPTGLRGLSTRFFRYLRDPRVPRWRKLAGVFAVLYFIIPTDLLPDILPVLGWLDDMGVLASAAIFMVREVQRHPPEPTLPPPMEVAPPP